MSRQVGNGGKIDEQGYSRYIYNTMTSGFFSPRTSTSWKVKQRGAGANMSVDVSQGDGMVDISSSYIYPAWVASADENVSVTAADPTNPRRDIAVAYIDLSTISTSVTNNTNALKFLVVAGTPAGSPSDPSGATIQSAVGASNPYIKLARVAVAAGATSISNANITDLRQSVSSILPQARQVTSVSATTTLDYSYDWVKVDASGGARTMTLPDATLQAGRVFTIEKNDSSTNVVTVATTSSQTINGSTNDYLSNQYDLIDYKSDGSNWIIDKERRSPLLAFASKTANAATSSATSVDIGISINPYIPAGSRYVIIRAQPSDVLTVSGSAQNTILDIWDGAVGSGTQVAQTGEYTNGYAANRVETPPLQLAAGNAKTYRGGFNVTGGATTTLTAGATRSYTLQCLLVS